MRLNSDVRRQLNSLGPNHRSNYVRHAGPKHNATLYRHCYSNTFIYNLKQPSDKVKYMIYNLFTNCHIYLCTDKILVVQNKNIMNVTCKFGIEKNNVFFRIKPRHLSTK